MRRIQSALLVDDDDAFRTTLQGSLRRRGVRARTAATVEEGQVILEEEPVDLVVVDYRMPRGDGLSALARFRRARPESVIVMLTGFGDIPIAVAAVKEGAVDYLAKPADADAIEAALLANGKNLPPPPQNPMSADRVRWEHIQRVYEQCDRNVSETARRLNMHRRTLQRKLRKRPVRR
jgi:two-component system response regulator RegA